MVEKNKLKTTKTWGKGGSILSLQPKGGLFYFITFVLIFLISFQPVAFAARSSAGGGKIEKFNTGRVIGSIGIGLGAMAVGGAISSGLSNIGSNTGAISAMGTSLANSCTLSGIATNFNTFVAASQVSRAIGMAGSYYGWKPSTTFIVSSFATGATAGFLNPTVMVGDSLSYSGGVLAQEIPKVTMGTMAKGAFVGGMTGLASSTAVVAIDGGKINKGEEPGVGAQVAGLVAGTMGANLARGLINPNTYTEIKKETYKRVENPKINEEKVAAGKAFSENADKALDSLNTGNFSEAWDNAKNMFKESYTHLENAAEVQKTEPNRYREVMSKSPFGGEDLSPKEFTAQEVVGLYDGNVRFEKTSGDYFRAVQTSNISSSDVASNLFDAAFVKTIDMWPQFAVRGLSIAATDSLGKNDRLMSPLVSSVVEGVASPVINSAAEMFALKPGLYIGKDSISNSIVHLDNLKQAAYVNYLSPKGDKIYGLYEQARNQNLTLEQFSSVLADNGFNVKGLDSLDREKYIQLTKENLEAQGLQPDQVDKELSKISSEEFNPKSAMMGIVMSRERVNAERMVKDASSSEALKILGTSRAGLFVNSSLNDMKYGLVEGAISGGVSSLASKYSENDPIVAAVASYGAAMATGAVRGLVRYANWEDNRNNFGDLVWLDQYREFAPRKSERVDYIQDSASENYYKRGNELFNKYGKLTGLNNEMIAGPGSGELILANKPLVFFDEAQNKPSPSEAVLFSLQQTNNEFLQRSFSFGAPNAHPYNVNGIMVNDYVNSLRGYGMVASRPGGFASAMTSGYINAGAVAVSNNIMTTMATSKTMAGLFSMQQERMVKTNAPNKPYMIQGRDFRPWALGVNTKFYLEDDYYRARSSSGNSFIRRDR